MIDERRVADVVATRLSLENIERPIMVLGNDGGFAVRIRAGHDVDCPVAIAEIS